MAGATEQLQARVLLWAREVFQLALDELLIRLDQEVPRGETGQLAQSRVVELGSTGGNMTATITYTAPQAEYTDLGTDPHSIDAAPGHFLRFEIAGEVIFVQHVDHPGSHLHDGWFSQTVLEWPEILQFAADSVS